METPCCKHPCMQRLFLIFITVFALTALAMMYLAPIADIDIWWHLATGRYLLENVTFLSSDPFGLAGEQITPGRELILNGYWLSQVIFYSIFQFFGLKGIIALRVILLIIPSLVVLVYGWSKFSRSSAVFLLALLSGWTMIYVSGIRPNHLTIAFVPLLFALLNEVSYAADWQDVAKYNFRAAWFLPPFMLIWANLHGGFLLGTVVLVIYATCETITLYKTKHTLKPTAKLWGIVVATTLATLATPNGILTYTQYLGAQGGIIVQKTSEYQSPFILAKNGVITYWPYFIVLLFTLLAIISRWRQIAFTRTVLLLFTAMISLTAFRYAPLFVGAATVLLIPVVQQIAGGLQRGKVLFDISSGVLFFMILYFSVVSYPRTAGALPRDGVIDPSRFPIEATNFIEKNQLSGVIFNHFNWGGFLLWRQPGKLKTFIDGRNLNTSLFHAYTKALWLPAETQAIFDRFGVDLIIMPRLNPFTGELYALTDFLWGSPLWVQIYRDPYAMILGRRERFPFFERDKSIDKSLIYEDVRKEVRRLRALGGNSVHLQKAERLATLRLLQNMPGQ